MLPLLENIFLMSKFRYQLMKLSQKIDEVFPLLNLHQVDKAIIESLCFIMSFINQRIKTVAIKIRNLLNNLVVVNFVKILLLKSSFINLLLK